MTSAIGDAFPEKYREESAKRNIKIGSVIRAKMLNTNPPKEKRFIIVGFSDASSNIGIVFINSEINPNIFHIKELKDLHISIESGDRTYIDHDSFIDCSQIYKIEIEKIIALLVSHAENYLGEISSDVMKEIKSKIKQSKTIPVSIKKEFGLFY